jgi:mono/diheme cytochrome c family protein
MLISKTLLNTLLMTAGLVASVMVTATAVHAQDAALIKKGQDVYTAQKCQICHSIAGKGGKASPLDGVGTKLSAADIREWITHPTEMTAKVKSTKKPVMPNKYGSLPAADIDALVAYMQSLK